jgi:hypothetical protein
MRQSAAVVLGLVAGVGPGFIPVTEAAPFLPGSLLLVRIVSVLRTEVCIFSVQWFLITFRRFSGPDSISGPCCLICAPNMSHVNLHCAG